jgi:hypothetical protein
MIAAGCTTDGGTASPVSQTGQASPESSLEASLGAENFVPVGSADGTISNISFPETGSSVQGVNDAADDALNMTVDVETTESDASLDSNGLAPCVTAGTELCDGFEIGQLDPKVWKVNLGGPSPTVTVDGLHAHSGKYAVHAKVTPGQQSTAQITESVTFPAADDGFYTRIWAYFSPDVAWPNNPPDFHTGFIIAGGNNGLGHVELAVGANLSPSSAAGPMHYLGYSIYRGPPYDEFGPRSPTQVATLSWTCIELLESGAGGSSAVRRIWVDGTELPEQYDSFGVSSPMGQKPPQFDLVSIGIWEYHPTPSLSDMWIDDVRVSSQRIGCAT